MCCGWIKQKGLCYSKIVKVKKKYEKKTYKVVETISPILTKLTFLHNVIFIETKVILHQACATLVCLDILYRPFWLHQLRSKSKDWNKLHQLRSKSKDWNKLHDFERNWWSLFQKRVMLTKFDIYVFLYIHLSSRSSW
jgi:hypothetical protein